MASPDAYKTAPEDTKMGTRGINVWGGVATSPPLPRQVQPKNGLAEDINGDGEVNQTYNDGDPYMERFSAPVSQ